MTNRFFVSPDTILKSKFVIKDPSLIHQMTRVLRFKPGEKIQLLDNSGKTYEAQVLNIDKKSISGEVENIFEKAGAPKNNINLCMALLKKDNFELVLEKATELGVSQFTPIITQRCVKKIEKIPSRWHMIIKEASEQCGRTTLPKINGIVEFKKAIAKYSPGIICLPGHENNVHNLAFGRDINLYIGPEGGFTEDEVLAARQNKIEPINLGSNILRAETAAITAVAILNI